MDASSRSAPRRSVTSVDLGELRARVVEVSAAAGVGPSTWLRSLVERKLGRAIEVSESWSGSPATSGARSQAVYRAWLDAELTDKLDERRRRDGFRTRASALRALIEGVGVTSGRDAGDGQAASLREAVDALGASNFQLVAIGRNVNQIAKALRAQPERAVAADRLALEHATAAIRNHLEQAAALVGQLRPMLKRSQP